MLPGKTIQAVVQRGGSEMVITFTDGTWYEVGVRADGALWSAYQEPARRDIRRNIAQVFKTFGSWCRSPAFSY